MSHIVIKLQDLIDGNDNVSKNQLCFDCRFQRTQLNKYCKNEVQRFDLSMLAKLCDYFHCTPNDILELVEGDGPKENIEV